MFLSDNPCKVFLSRILDHYSVKCTLVKAQRYVAQKIAAKSWTNSPLQYFWIHAAQPQSDYFNSVVLTQSTN